MPQSVPTPLAAALGLVPTVLGGVRRLPGRAVQLPVIAVGSALSRMDAARREYLELADRGERLVARLRGTSFDELEDRVEDALQGTPLARPYDVVEDALEDAGEAVAGSVSQLTARVAQRTGRVAQQAEQTVDKAAEATADTAAKAADVVEKTADKAEKTTSKAAAKAGKAASKAAGKAEKTAAKAADKVEKTAGEAAEKVEKTAGDVADRAEEAGAGADTGPEAAAQAAKAVAQAERAVQQAAERAEKAAAKAAGTPAGKSAAKAAREAKATLQDGLPADQQPKGAATPAATQPDMTRIDTAASPDVVDTVERVAAKAAGPAVLDHDDLPLADYDHMTLGSLRGRLRSLDLGQLVQVRNYEKAHADRLPVVTMLDNRIAKLAVTPAAEQPGADEADRVTHAASTLPNSTS